MHISENFDAIEGKIRAACLRCGRDRSTVTLVGVTKKMPVPAVREAIETTPLRNFGENYVQEYIEKRAVLGSSDAVWHFIGHLQCNKVRRLLSCPPDLIHSVDSVGLIRQIERVMREMYPGGVQRILVELRIGDEDGAKTGVDPSEIGGMAEAIEECPHVRWCGLMLVPPAFDDPEDVRPYFRRVRAIRDELSVSGHKGLDVLSYGMSHDFEIALEEGATHVRIGTAIFGRRG